MHFMLSDITGNLILWERLEWIIKKGSPTGAWKLATSAVGRHCEVI